MDFPPFITAPADEQEAPAATNVVQFPPLVSAREKLRHAQRNLARCEANVENCDPHSPDLRERLDAALSLDMLPHWREQIQKAAALIAMLEASDTLAFNGRVYQATRSPAGAN